MATRYQPAFPPDHYLNRELSWLEFNARVLEEAADKTPPLLERLKFAAIFSSNLDEFFEVRVAGLQQQLYAGIEPQDYGADGLDPAQQLGQIATRVHALVAEQHRLLDGDRKSTRLNSSHQIISYAVFCFKKKKQHYS